MTMCKVLEDMRNETIEREREEMALRMLADGMADEQIAEITKLTLEKVQKLAREKSA